MKDKIRSIIDKHSQSSNGSGYVPMESYDICATEIMELINTESVPKNEMPWLMNRVENYQNRYIEAETKLLHVAEMPWYCRLFIGKAVMEFLDKANCINQ